jgi:ADP-heptose:LPS heptosyltransferase
MIKKAKFSSKLKRVFFNTMGSTRATAYLSSKLSKRLKNQTFSFPVTISTINNVLIILPEEQTEILYQLKNILSIISHFRHAAITLLCEEQASSFIKMIPGVTIVEYNKTDHDFFDSDFFKIARSLGNPIDICFLLDRTPDLQMLYFTGLTGADLRVGYAEAGSFPFLNTRVQSSNAIEYIPDKNCLIAELFGFQTEKMTMIVAHKTIEEIEHLLKEHTLTKKHSLVGLDYLFFAREFGTKWLEQFINTIRKYYNGNLYLYVSEEPSLEEKSWLKSQSEVPLPPMSSSRLAALIVKTDLILTGNTMLYGIAAILDSSAMGFFKEDSFNAFCPRTNNLQGFTYDKLPDDQSIAVIMHMLETLCLKQIKNQKKKT